MRHDSAAHVLSLYRSRPVSEANKGPKVLSVHDCIRLALDNNLDIQVALWDQQVKAGQAHASTLRSLPRIEGGFYQTRRGNLPFSRSDVIDNEGAYEVLGPGPGTGVTNFSVGRERGQRNWQVQLAWSPMDAYMASCIAETRATEAGQAGYQRYRVAQQLVGTITGTFYRLLALEHALPKAQALETHRSNIVRDLSALVSNQQVDPHELITARSLLAEAKNQASEIFINIGRQREILSVSMAMTPDCDLRLIGQLLPLPITNLDPCHLEGVALVNRPEAYQADLAVLGSIADQKRLLMKFFPRAEGFLGYFRDENKFLYYRDWLDGGLKVTFDLLDFTANLMEHGAARDRVIKTDRERAVISMGIISQVRLRTLEAMKAIERFHKQVEVERLSAEGYRVARDIEEVKERGAPHRVMLINREKALCALLQAKVDVFSALGEAHAALADVEAAVGTNHPIPQDVRQCSGTGSLSALFHAPVAALKRAGHGVRGVVPKLW
jgi:outer membrane protein TolC